LSRALSDANSGRPIPGRRPPTENWHVTLRFLGECGDHQTDLMMHSLSESISASPSRVWCDGLNAFPRPSRAGVVFVGVDDPTGILDHLAAVCEEAAIDAGFEPEDRPYVPHLTLSRLESFESQSLCKRSPSYVRMAPDTTPSTPFRSSETLSSTEMRIIEHMFEYGSTVALNVNRVIRDVTCHRHSVPWR